jgi:phage tail-like protein
VLKRGITEARHLWQWFELVNVQGKYASRLDVTVTLLDAGGKPLLKWLLVSALPVKFKAPDLNATAAEVGIEELHLVHEGLSVARPQ